MLTATFYGLSLSVAGFLVALYVWMVGDISITLTQSILFAVIWGGCAFLLPKFLKPSWDDVPQGLTRYIGKKTKLKKVWDDWKILLDWVEYLVSDECADISKFKDNETVFVQSQENAIFTVSVKKV